MTGFLLSENGAARSAGGHEALLQAARKVALPLPSPGDPRWADCLFELARSPDIARLVLHGLEVDPVPDLDQDFPSPLPLPEPGVARLWRGPDEGTILLTDERLRGEDGGVERRSPTITLVEVYASLLRGKIVRMSKSTLSVWAIRTYRDIGLIDVAPVRLPPLPPAEQDKVQRLHATIEDLLSVRYTREVAPVPLAHGFLNDWSGQGERQIGEAMKQLLRLGIIHKSGTHEPERGFKMSEFAIGPCPEQHGSRLWRHPLENARWHCCACVDPPAGPEIELLTPDPSTRASQPRRSATRA